MAESWSHALSLPDVAATQALGRALAPLLRTGDIVALQGALGMGKTELARAMIQSLLPHNTPIPSPSFTLVQHYTTATGSLAHFDLYRLKHADEIFELGWEDACGDSIMIVEWPERAGPYLPEHALTITLSQPAADGRRATCTGAPTWATRLDRIF